MSAALVKEPPPAVESEVVAGQAEIIEPLLEPGSGGGHDLVAQRQDIERAGIRVPSIGDRVARHIVNLPVFRTLFFEESKGALYGGEALLDDGDKGGVYVTEEGKAFVWDLGALAWLVAALIVVPVMIGILVSRLRAAKLRTLRLRQQQISRKSSKRGSRRSGKRRSSSRRKEARQPGS